MENISIAKRTTDPGIDKNKVKLQNLGQTSAWFCLAKGENKFDKSVTVVTQQCLLCGWTSFQGHDALYTCAIDEYEGKGKIEYW